MNEANKPTVVIDTNLFISAIIIKGYNAPNELLTAWRADTYHLLMSEELFIEVEEVLKREKIYKKYNIQLAEIEAFITELHNAAGLVTPLKLDVLPLHSRDHKDDKFIACALGGNCDYLITGDKDLLMLNGKPKLGKLKIITAAAFLQERKLG